MTEAFYKLADYLQNYPFVRYALAVGVLVALCSALFGVTLVLKHFSFIGDGLSHVAFGALAVAAVLRIRNEMPLVLLITVLAAILLLRGGRRVRTRGDASIALLSVSAMAIGYLLLNRFPTSGNVSADVCTSLFGSTSILTLTREEVLLSALLSLAVIVLFLLLYHRIFAVTFDETFAMASGGRAELYNLFIAVVTAVIIVLAMNLVGSLLVSALVIFPVLAAMRLFRSFAAVTAASAVFAVFCAALGILAAILAGTPVGATIVAANLVCYLLCAGLGALRGT